MIDKLAYDKSFRDVDFYRREYEKALSHLQFMSSGVPYGRVDLNEVELLKREMKRMQTEHQKELMQLSSQMDAITAVRSEIDMTMNLRIDDPEMRTFFIAKMDAMILFHSDCSAPRDATCNLHIPKVRGATDCCPRFHPKTVHLTLLRFQNVYDILRGRLGRARPLRCWSATNHITG